MAILTLSTAAHIADTALSTGNTHGFAPLAVVVLDLGGHILVVKRNERASLYRADIATAKAKGCLGMGMGGRALAARAAKMPALYAAFNIVTEGVIPVAGGVLIRDKAGHTIGAVGISGDTADNDERCAVVGIEVAGCVADTGSAE